MATRLSAELFIPEVLRQYCGKARTLDITGGTVHSVLDELERDYPALHVNICDETGAVRRHINIFVNDDHMRDRDGLNTPVVAGDVVTVLPAVSGG